MSRTTMHRLVSLNLIIDTAVLEHIRNALMLIINNQFLILFKKRRSIPDI
ncbi:MAG: hypothetical protein ABII01_01020 [Candidatus Woesearchaeota archaeon]